MAGGFSPTAHWRDSARVTKLFVIDAAACFPLLLFLLHIEWWTFFCALVATIFFTLMARFGFTIPVFIRWLRLSIAGYRKIAVPYWRS